MINAKAVKFFDVNAKIVDYIGVAYFLLKKLNVSSYEGNAVIISDNNGYQTRVIQTMGDEVTKELKDMLIEIIKLILYIY